jgi:hypothetical protein
MICDYSMLIREAAVRGQMKVSVILPHEAASIKAIDDARTKEIAEGILIGQGKTIKYLLNNLNVPASRLRPLRQVMLSVRPKSVSSLLRRVPRMCF